MQPSIALHTLHIYSMHGRAALYRYARVCSQPAGTCQPVWLGDKRSCTMEYSVSCAVLNLLG